MHIGKIMTALWIIISSICSSQCYQKKYPEKILAMPYGQSMNSLVLMHHLGDRFEQKKWDNLTQRVGFHKLAFRVSKEIKEDKENYFNKIISLYT